MRLGIVDELASSDRAPIELRRRFGLPSNLLAHHLDVLEGEIIGIGGLCLTFLFGCCFSTIC